MTNDLTLTELQQFIGGRRSGSNPHGLEFREMDVILDTTNSVLLSERHAASTAGS